MKLTHLLIAGATAVSFSAIAAEEAKKEQQGASAGASQTVQGGAHTGAQAGARGDAQSGAQARSPETVKQVQEKLSAAGHDAGPVDGKLGPKTQAALKKFQQSKGLQASGRIDQQTLAALQVGAEGASTGASAETRAKPDSQVKSESPAGEKEEKKEQPEEKKQ